MTEILTESFCERCGTRYTFESARPRVRLKGVKVLSRGLKNFVLSDDSSMDEAMAAARSDTDRELTSHQLDAFHKTFNFCMSCRQYTCPNCWNGPEARCLTCAPHLGHDVMPAPFPDLVTSSYLMADPVDVVPANGSNVADGTAGTDLAEEASASTVDVSDFASRLQALMAPPDGDPKVDVAAAPAVADRVDLIGDAVPAPRADDVVPEDEPVVAAALDEDAPVSAALADAESVPETAGDSEPAPETQAGPVSPIPYQIGAAAIATDPQSVSAEVERVAAEPVVEIEPVPAAAEIESAPAEIEPMAAEIEPMAAEIEPAAAAADPVAAAAEVEPAAAEIEPMAAAAEVEPAAAEIEPMAAEVEPAVADIEPVAAAAEAEPAVAEIEPAAAAADVEPVANEFETQTLVVAPELETAAISAAVTDDDAGIGPESDDDAEIAARLAAFGAAAVVVDAARDDKPSPSPSAGDKGAAQTGGLLRRFRAGQSLDAELDAYERAQPTDGTDAYTDADTVIAAAAAVAPMADAEGAATEPEVAVAAEPSNEPLPDPAVDVIQQPTWQIVAPDPAADTTSQPPVAPPGTSMPAAATVAAPTAEPQWPVRPQWPGGASPAAGLPFLNRPPTPTGGLEALWAASARDVVAPPEVAGRPAATAGVQPCLSCGLSLSATARFCRRCGTPQAS